MKKVSFLFFILAMSAVAMAETPKAIDQLGLDQRDDHIAVPMPVTANKGIVGATFHWNPNAPFSYHQNRAEIVDRRRSTVTIKNVRWGSVPEDKRSYEWETVTIRPFLLEKTFYGSKPGHTFLVFVFKPGGVTDSQGRETLAITMGAEGWTREPDGYSPITGLTKRYPLIWNLSTLENYADFAVTVAQRELELYTMNISRAQAGEMLENAFERIDETNANREVYNTVTNNCTSNPVELVNSVLPTEQTIRPMISRRINFDFLTPWLARDRFIQLGVLNPMPLRIDASNYRAFDIATY